MGPVYYPSMKVYHMRVKPGELPAWDHLKSKSVTMLVPFKGWVQQTNPTADEPRAVLPLTTVSVKGMSRWVKEKTRRFRPKKGSFVLVYRLESQGYSFGFYHDTRPNTLSVSQDVSLDGVALPTEVSFEA